MFEPIKNIVDRVLAGKKQKSVFDAAEICAVTERLILTEVPRLRARFKVKFFKNGLIFIAAENSAIANELHLLENSILIVLKKRYPEVRQLRYSLERIISDS